MGKNLTYAQVKMGASVNVHFSQHFAKRLLESHLLWQTLDQDHFTFEKVKTNTKRNQFFHEQESQKQKVCMCVKYFSVGSGHVNAKALMKGRDQRDIHLTHNSKP